MKKIMFLTLIFLVFRYDNISTKVNDFPTYARSEFVFACMSSNANNRDFMAKCSCAVDEIAKRISFKEYAQAEAIARLWEGVVQGRSFCALDYQRKMENYSEHKQLLSSNVFSSY